jgi:hypothetical protein
MVIDLADSYHQFLVKPKDQQKLAFTIDREQSMFVVAPFKIKMMLVFCKEQWRVYYQT